MKVDRMRQRLVQVLRRQEDSDSLDLVLGRFWAPAKPLRRSPAPASDPKNVVDLAGWIAERDERQGR